MKNRFGVETTITPVLGADGTVHFRPYRPLIWRVLDWVLAFLWSLVPITAIAAIFW